MPIRLKVARTDKELDDVFKLRYDVYVRERSKFSEKRSTNDGRIVDHFDTLAGVANVVAYDGNTAIASFRINSDSTIGLAPEKYFNFSQERENIARSAESKGYNPCIVSCSMLAIRKQWRHRRNVIFALFKTATAVMHDQGATHVFGAASAETFSLYGRLGVKAVAEKQWVESVGDDMVPVMGDFDKVFAWAFGTSTSINESRLTTGYFTEFETLLLSPGEVLFRENDRANFVYSIIKGGISISKGESDQKDFVIAQLGRGALFGELAVLNDERRLVTATAVMNTQITAIERNLVFDAIPPDHHKIDQQIHGFRQGRGEGAPFVMVEQSSPLTGRGNYVLERLRAMDIKGGEKTALAPQVKDEQIAKRVAISSETGLHRVLEKNNVSGGQDYGGNLARFVPAPPSEVGSGVDGRH